MVLGSGICPWCWDLGSVPRKRLAAPVPAPALCSMSNIQAKPPTREDVHELAAAMVRQLSGLSAGQQKDTDSGAGVAAGSAPATRQAQGQAQGQSRDRRASIDLTATAAAAAAATAAAAAVPGHPAPSDGRNGVEALPPGGGGGVYVAPGATPFGPDDIAFEPLLQREPDGYLSAAALQQQEAALASCLAGLVSQVRVFELACLRAPCQLELDRPALSVRLLP